MLSQILKNTKRLLAVKKLVIVEYTTHEPYIRALVELFCDEYEIVVLTSEEYCKKFFK